MNSFLQAWRTALHRQFLQGIVPKTLIVNKEDLSEYERQLEMFYKGGFIPIVGGVLRYKNVPIGISDELKRGECAVEI